MEMKHTRSGVMMWGLGFNMSFFCLALVLFAVGNRKNVKTTPKFWSKESMELLSLACDESFTGTYIYYYYSKIGYNLRTWSLVPVQQCRPWDRLPINRHSSGPFSQELYRLRLLLTSYGARPDRWAFNNVHLSSFTNQIQHLVRTPSRCRDWHHWHSTRGPGIVDLGVFM